MLRVQIKNIWTMRYLRSFVAENWPNNVTLQEEIVLGNISLIKKVTAILPTVKKFFILTSVNPDLLLLSTKRT